MSSFIENLQRIFEQKVANGHLPGPIMPLRPGPQGKMIPAPIATPMKIPAMSPPSLRGAGSGPTMSPSPTAAANSSRSGLRIAMDMSELAYKYGQKLAQQKFAEGELGNPHEDKASLLPLLAPPFGAGIAGYARGNPSGHGTSGAVRGFAGGVAGGAAGGVLGALVEKALAAATKGRLRMPIAARMGGGALGSIYGTHAATRGLVTPKPSDDEDE